MNSVSEAPNLGKNLQSGDEHYRAYVGPPEKYDLMSANQFNLLTLMGLREEHDLLDIGCGSLRAGRLFIPYLLPGKYCGLEPNRWLVEEGIKNEVGADLARIKQPTFLHDENFTLTAFGRKFDFLLAQSVFSHAAPQQIARCLQQAKLVLKPGGMFVMNFMRGQTDYAGSEWIYPGCSEYTDAGFERMAAEWKLSFRTLNWFHPNALTWTVLYHEEDEAAPPELAAGSNAGALEGMLKNTEKKRRRLEKRLAAMKSRPVLRLAMKLDRALGGKSHEENS